MRARQVIHDCILTPSQPPPFVKGCEQGRSRVPSRARRAPDATHRTGCVKDGGGCAHAPRARHGARAGGGSYALTTNSPSAMIARSKPPTMSVACHCREVSPSVRRGVGRGRR